MNDAETLDSDFDAAALDRRLNTVWSTPPGLLAALSTVDHKIIGRRYILTAFVFLALGGLLALLIRLQLAQPEARVLSPAATTRSLPCMERT